jgi:transcriptional regulator with XRE-family HTH domain
MPPIHVDAGDVVVGTRLRWLRTKQGLTQPQLAKKLGILQSSVSRYESGRTSLSFSEIVEICKVLDEDPSVFFVAAVMLLNSDVVKNALVEIHKERKADFLRSLN